MLNQQTESGLYLVTLNNDAPISANADDCRVAHRVIKVRKGNVKVGQAANLIRRCGNYARTFGRENLNFHILAYIPGGKSDLDRVESVVLDSLAPHRLRGLSGRLTEWVAGVSASRVREIALKALRRSGVEHVVASDDGKCPTEAWSTQPCEEIPLMADRSSDTAHDDASAKPMRTDSHARRTLELIGSLFSEGPLTDADFKRLHHLETGLEAHRKHCAKLDEGGGDFAQDRRGEPNRNVCRRLELIANELGRRDYQVTREEIEELIEYALRECPFESKA